LAPGTHVQYKLVGKVPHVFANYRENIVTDSRDAVGLKRTIFIIHTSNL
jgi:hypothetical protein